MGIPERSQLDVAYVYDGSLEGLLTAVFVAYERHEHPADVASERQFQARLGQHVVEVSTDMSKACRVRDGLVRAAGQRAFAAVRAVSLSDEPSRGGAVLDFVSYAMSRGPQALDDVVHPRVAEFSRICRAVENERQHWQQFMRFSQVEGGVYVARCNPNASVVPLLMGWFSARFNTQAFLIYDEVHEMAGVSDGGSWQLVRTDELFVPSATAHDAYIERAWKTFYDTIAVEARYNPELRRQFIPKRFWENVVEMRDISRGDHGQREERRELSRDQAGAQEHMQRTTAACLDAESASMEGGSGALVAEASAACIEPAPCVSEQAVVPGECAPSAHVRTRT